MTAGWQLVASRTVETAGPPQVCVSPPLCLCWVCRAAVCQARWQKLCALRIMSIVGYPAGVAAETQEPGSLFSLDIFCASTVVSVHGPKNWRESEMIPPPQSWQFRNYRQVKG